jgi:hypothetical protein
MHCRKKNKQKLKFHAHLNDLEELFMFDTEKAEYEKFFDFYKKKFDEEVAIMPGVFEDDDFEIDLLVGEKSETIRGVRILNFQPYEEEDDEEDKKANKEIDELPEAEEDEDESDSEDDEEDVVEVFCYDLVATEGGKIKGELLFEIYFRAPGEDSEVEGDEEQEEIKTTEENYWANLKVYASDEGISSASLSYREKPNEEIILLDDPELDKL